MSNCDERVPESFSRVHTVVLSELSETRCRVRFTRDRKSGRNRTGSSLTDPQWVDSEVLSE